MANIWQPPPGGYQPGPGLVCVASLDSDPDHPWGRTNPWAYDGAIYGYREFADPPNANFQYSVLGGIINVCTIDPDISAPDKLNATGELNDGCNADPFLAAHVLALSVADISSDPVWQLRVNCTTDGGSTVKAIKASMAVWGIPRDVMSNNDLSRDETPSDMAFGEDSGSMFLQLTFATEAANDLWVATLVPEVIALWNEH